MHALKFHGTRTVGQVRVAPSGARTGTVGERTIFVQNTREQPARGPGVRCDWGITCLSIHYEEKKYQWYSKC